MRIDINNMSMVDFYVKFRDEQTCKEYFTDLRWSEGQLCIFCGHKKVYVTNRGFKCGSSECYRQFNFKTKTIFESSKVPLSIWFYLIYSYAINKKNISSVQIAKNIGVTQTTAWYMMSNIRGVFAEKEIVRLSGIVEVDECFIGKGNRWTRWGSMSTRKTPILGIIERGGKVVIKAIEDRTRITLEEIILTHVEKGSTVYTDGLMSYRNLSGYYKHAWLDHSSHEYARGSMHTNTIENFWSHFKRGIRNGSHFISAEHVQRYCDEVAYRHNYKHLNFKERFNDILSRCINRVPIKHNV